MSQRQALVFGGHGELGAAIVGALADSNYRVLRTSRQAAPDAIAIDPFAAPDSLAQLDELPRLDAVVWAQGANANDSVLELDFELFQSVMNANVSFIVATLDRLARSDRLAEGAGLCVLSSIWQEVARAGKFSYTVSKAAIGGLVRSAAIDLADRGIRINAVLPGVVRTPMSEQMLSEEQIASVAAQTGFKRLVSPQEVANLVAMLVSPQASGVTGQSIPVDLGFVNARDF